MTSAELIRLIVEQTGIGKTEVNMTAVWLREAGLIKKAGRGLSAVDMTPRDAVNLLIGLAASKTAKGSMFVVPYYREITDIEGRKFADVFESIIANRTKSVRWIHIRKVDRQARYHLAEAIIKYKDNTPAAFFSKSPRAAVKYTRYRDDGTVHGDLLNAIAGEL